MMNVNELVENVRTIINSEDIPYDFTGIVKEEEDLSEEYRRIIINRVVDQIKSKRN